MLTRKNEGRGTGECVCILAFYAHHMQQFSFGLRHYHIQNQKCMGENVAVLWKI